MGEPVPSFESPPPPSATVSSLSTTSLNDQQEQKSDGREQGREGEGEGTHPQNPNCNSDPRPRQDPQSLNLESRNPHPLNSSDPPTGSIDIHRQEEEGEHEENRLVVDEPEEMQDVEDPEGVMIARSPPPSTAIASSSRRGAPKRKKGAGKYSRVKQAAMEKKFQTLMENFKVIPFEPRKSPEFSSHEELLKRMGLWDFAHIEFDRNLREDLIGKLIVNYSATNRCSYVDGHRIMVNRADLGRALHLYGKKQGEWKTVDGQETTWPEKFVSFVDEFVSNWMLLHGDMWVLPPEILNWTRIIKEGHLEKVDWSGLIWYMVEKELSQGVNLKECYYASHLQQLIKVQKKDLFEKNESMAVQEVFMVKEDDVDNKGDAKMAEPYHGGPDLSEQNIQLSLGPDLVLASSDNVGTNHDGVADASVGSIDDVDDGKVGNVDNVVDGNVGSIDNVGDMKIGGTDNVNNTLFHGDGCVEKIMKDVSDVANVEGADSLRAEETGGTGMMNLEQHNGDEQNQWFSVEKNNGNEHFLQPCSLNSKLNVAYEQVERDQVSEQHKIEDDEVEGNEQVERFKTQQKCNSFNGLSSGNFMQPMDSSQMAFTSSDFGGQPSLDLLSPRVENHVMLGVLPMFGKANKRNIDHEPDISHDAPNDSNKRLRANGPWDSEVPDFEFCFDQMQQWIGKARLSYASTRERAFQQANINQHFLFNELEAKDHIIHQLRSSLEVLQKRRQAESIRFDNELSVMSSLIDGYRRALKDMQKAFADYKKRIPVLEGPLYKDAGEGGVMKSAIELEKERLIREEEENITRIRCAESVENTLKEWNVTFGGFLDRIEMLGRRLLDLVKAVELLRETNRKKMASKTGGVAASDQKASGEVF